VPGRFDSSRQISGLQASLAHFGTRGDNARRSAKTEPDRQKERQRAAHSIFRLQ
jgi:hypothetical protein